ncbi:hypothetical protein Ae406Ps2_6396c [Pseudonocardia sp. Ae406_Ps2]|nr:hypothetical protein Ae406Ps2_6396c [Pseudonocardia sp. Ae406_Ps2]
MSGLTSGNAAGRSCGGPGGGCVDPFVDVAVRWVAAPHQLGEGGLPGEAGGGVGGGDLLAGVTQGDPVGVA